MLNSKRTVVLLTILLLICFSGLPSAIAQSDRGTITERLLIRPVR
jgi:hypothetical protein